LSNLYNNPIVICDVSSKNPNVMFELGLRLAFDKPTIIIKDDSTSITFDAGVIEHLTYSKELKYDKIKEFQSDLTRRIVATSNKSRESVDYSPFLKSFGKNVLSSQIKYNEVSEMKYLIEQIDKIKIDVDKIKISVLKDKLVDDKDRLLLDKKNLRQFLKELIQERKSVTYDDFCLAVKLKVEENKINISDEEFVEIINDVWANITKKLT